MRRECEWFECHKAGTCEVKVAGNYHWVCGCHYMRFQGLDEDDVDLFSKIRPPRILPY